MFISEKDFIKVGCPKISWDGKNYLMKVYCNIGSDFSQLSFSFDVDKFLYLYNECKGRFHLVDGSGFYDKSGFYHLSYLDFSRRVLGGNVDSEIIEIFSWIIKFYQLNPSVCKRAIFKKFKGKGHTRRLELELKKSAVDKLVLGRSSCGGARVKGSRMLENLKNVDVDKVENFYWLMQDCVRRSAIERTLQYFGEYKDFYINWEIASGLRSGYGRFLSSSKEKALFMRYKTEVEYEQENNLCEK